MAIRLYIYSSFFLDFCQHMYNAYVQIYNVYVGLISC